VGERGELEPFTYLSRWLIGTRVSILVHCVNFHDTFSRGRRNTVSQASWQKKLGQPVWWGARERRVRIRSSPYLLNPAGEGTYSLEKQKHETNVVVQAPGVGSRVPALGRHAPAQGT